MRTQVDVEAAVPIFFADVQACSAGDPGIREIHVHGAEFALCKLDQPPDLDGVGRICREVDGRAGSPGVDFVRHFLGGLGVQIGDDDPRAPLRELFGQRAADPAPTAGDNRDLVVDFHTRNSFR